MCRGKKERILRANVLSLQAIQPIWVMFMQCTLQLPSSSKSPCIVSSITVCFTSTKDDPYAVTTMHKDKPKQEKKVKCMSHVYRTRSVGAGSTSSHDKCPY